MAMFWNCEILESDISPPQKTEKQKYFETATSTRWENKTVHQIGILNLRWYQRNYSLFVPFLNSVALRGY